MITWEEFARLAVASGLVAEEGLHAALSQIPELMGRRASEAERLSELVGFLVESGVLTPWQCRLLLERRDKGFFLGKYKLKDYIFSSPEVHRYLAENIETKETMQIVVTPDGDDFRLVALRQGIAIEHAKLRRTHLGRDSREG